MQRSHSKKRKKSVLRCSKCRKLFLTAEERISHARTKHNVHKKEYPCLDCKLVGYVSQEHMEKHMQTRCPGRGWETRIKAKGPGKNKSNAHLEKPTPKATLNLEPLLNSQVQKRAPRSTPTLQVENRCDVLKGYRKPATPTEETSAARLSEVSSSSQFPPIGVRASTRIHSLPSCEPKQAQSTKNANLSLTEPSSSKQNKIKKRMSLNLTITNKNVDKDLGPMGDSVNSMEESAALLIIKLDSPCSLKKSRAITSKSFESPADASDHLRDSVELTSSAKPLNVLNLSQTSVLPQTSSNTSPQPITTSKQLFGSCDSSINHKLVDAPLDFIEPSIRKKVSSKLKPIISTVKHRTTQDRACKKFVSRTPPCQRTHSAESIASPPLGDIGKQSPPVHRGTHLNAKKEASNAEAVEIPRSEALSIPEALVPFKKSGEDLNENKRKENYNDKSPVSNCQPFFSNVSDEVQAEKEIGASSQTAIASSDVVKKNTPESPLATNAKSPSTLGNTAHVETATGDSETPFLPLIPLKYSPDQVKKSGELMPNKLLMDFEPALESISPLSEPSFKNGKEVLPSEMKPCRAIQTYEAESSEAAINTRVQELKQCQQSSGVDEVSKQANLATNTISTANGVLLAAACTVAAPTQMMEKTGGAAATTTPSSAAAATAAAAKVALMDWDSFIATVPRKACHNGVKASTATNTAPATSKLIKSPLKNQSISSASLVMASNHGPHKLPSQIAERHLQHTQREQADEDASAPAVNSGQDLLTPPIYNGGVEGGQSPQRHLRPRISVNYSNSKQKAMISEIDKRLDNYEGSMTVVTRLNKNMGDEEEDEEDLSQRKIKREDKHMTTHCCPVCRLTGFTTLAELRVHRTISCRRKGKDSKRTNKRNIEWYCPGCQNSQTPFESAVALLTHLLTCRKRRPGGKVAKVDHPNISSDRICPSTLFGPSTTFGCSICGAIVASESRLDKHRRDEHNH